MTAFVLAIWADGGYRGKLVEWVISFSQILADLDRTQDQLQAAHNRIESSDLEVTKEDKTIAEHLAEYALHEAYHVGQLDLLRQAVEG